MRLIDADALPKYTGYALSANEVAEAVENAPTIDAVPCGADVSGNRRCVLMADNKLTLGELLERSGTLDDDYGNGYYFLDIRDECEDFTWIRGTSHSRLIWLLGDIPVSSFKPDDKNTLVVWVDSDYITEELKRRNET